MRITVPELYTRVFNKIVSTPVTSRGASFLHTAPFNACIWELASGPSKTGAFGFSMVYPHSIHTLPRLCAQGLVLATLATT